MAGRTFSKAPAHINQLIRQTAEQYHPDLVEFKIKLEALYAFAPRNKYGIISGAAIRVGGYEAWACVRVTTLEERVAGRADAIIHFDGDRFKDLQEETQIAIIDHELTHLEPVRDKFGKIKTDDHGRVELKLRLHDFQVGWFDDVAKRHGDKSIEVMQARLLAQEKQLYFPEFRIITIGGRRRGA